MPFDRSFIENALLAVSSADALARRAAPVPVAHYTRIGSLSHFLVKMPSAGWGSAWATPVQFLNDRQELALGLDRLQGIAQEIIANERNAKGALETFVRIRTALDGLRTTLGGLGTDAYQMSFSGDPDELGQWRGYAANGMGCCLVTNTQEVRRVADVAGWVLYDQAEQAEFARLILDGLRSETDPDVIGQTLVVAACFMKHEGFRPEKEFRLLNFPQDEEIRFRETGDRLVPYVDFLKKEPPLSPEPLEVQKILIGPGWQLSRLSGNDRTRHHVFQGIQRLLDVRGLRHTDIESSQIPYDPS